ncbi:hypothetical protein CcaverHIS002_0505540 [Cutaneotrichosporon cavernicola]|uniref:Shwachman-Bodian-diamond syndrome protein n=1 Tax=Cutaneotrichosporon cavernicola TaxID=279322 RepID=A0AA48L6R6_9TREE|nr:uncharacterized protein CcaverHIS019_0506060 [Cutaneotrichosporon cavernicola]BEI85153.1 hypothetical protein CcaverHIS002_0505540 [Cutaneotrichosporon cavernicola]BEI92978.1 hypothetical protein CcaverHIS019_0506060 [Cutaneotrichosporon cavernicola]BEJ00754.1 hypothetical protein CcaverHIS631_0506110 [Cutaneotrichosporon cavernicola]
MQTKQPGTHIKLTNVSIVRIKKGGKRFEIACYKNKVNEFRSGVEKDLSEVLQIEQIFTNVPKGQVAKKDDWTKAFKNEDMDAVIEEILRKGELQVNNLERGAQLASLSREIATMVTEMTVDPTTGRKHTVGMVEKAMAELGYSVRGDKTAKAQALDLIRQLGADSILPVQRVRMRVRITMPAKDGKRVKDKVVALIDEVEEEDIGAEWEAIVRVDPGAFRAINELVSNESKGKGRVESMGSVST